MSDLIRREDAIKALQELDMLKESRWSALAEANPIQFVCRMYLEAENVIEALPSAEPERKWIPVTEALPKNSEHDWVLGQIRETDSGYLWIPRQVEYRQITDDWFEESIGWFKKNPDHAFEVLAWMPLPEPYRGDHE